MAMDRETMAAIFGQLPVGHMQQAMKAIGITMDCGDYMDGDADADTGLKPWSAKDVHVDAVKKPQLFDGGSLFKSEASQPGEHGGGANPSAYMPQQDDYSELAQYMPKEHGMGP